MVLVAVGDPTSRKQEALQGQSVLSSLVTGNRERKQKFIGFRKIRPNPAENSIFNLKFWKHEQITILTTIAASVL